MPDPGHTFFIPQRFRVTFLLAAGCLCTWTALRVLLLSYSHADMDLSLLALVKIFCLGILSDLVTLSYAMPLFFLYLALVPNSFYDSKAHRALDFLFLFFFFCLLLFSLIGEFLFWQEFGNRYNFIAVDYLVYTHEVLDNIRESYPVKTILSVIAAISAITVFIFNKFSPFASDPFSTYRQRLMTAGLSIIIPIFFFICFPLASFEIAPNKYVNEAAKNGIYTLVHAFRENSIDYEKFYKTESNAIALGRLRELLLTKDGKFTNADSSNITRKIIARGPELHKNVIVLTIESLSASFLGVFGNKESLTPNLDALSKESIFFTNLYATGSRTVRGLEAIALSIPPTPGNSIVRRPENKNLFSVGQIFRDRAYDVKFIYGGFGYFDNMNTFFRNNEFDIVDRADLSKEEITFGNAWGVSDEDLFNRAIREADHSFENGKHFFSLVMSTSNHRPYTYPQKIDIKSGSTRQGAVKYTDYAIGEFFKAVKTKPWFKDTIFVVIADHCASSAGKVDLPLREHHIPLFIFSPGFIRPQTITQVSSQIDLAPTLLGLLNFSYESKFYGVDLLHEKAERALIGNYQKLALYRNDTLAILSPQKKADVYKINPRSLEQIKISADGTLMQLINDTVSYYETASYLYKNKLFNYRSEIK